MNWNDLNWLDLVLVLIILLSIVGGYRKGLIRIGIGLFATIAAIVLACWFYGAAGTFVIPYVSSRSMANLIGFLIVFLGVLTIGAVLSRILAAIFKWVGLSWFDRILGAVFGALRGVVISIGVIMMITALSPVTHQTAVANSEIAPYLIEAADAITLITPKEFKDSFQRGYEKVKATWNEAFEKNIRKSPSRKD